MTRPFVDPPAWLHCASCKRTYDAREPHQCNPAGHPWRVVACLVAALTLLARLTGRA